MSPGTNIVADAAQNSTKSTIGMLRKNTRFSAAYTGMIELINPLMNEGRQKGTTEV
ncbi:MAG TPA: hypothetical protein VEC37_12225 [Bacillota bacterium]|nr:hypothetical protein [Bacillota bacterium]